MIKDTLEKLKLYKKTIFFVSLLPLVSLTVSAYAYNVTFNNGEASYRNFVSPITVNAPDIQGVASESAQSESASESAAPSLAKQSSEVKPEATVTVSPTSTPAKTGGGEENPKPISRRGNAGRINFPNNKFGIHIFASEDDVDLAAQLVNSNGGDWGWTTITMDINERNSEKWNNLFARMLEKHTIPIIQLSNNGKIPTEDEIEGIAAFLSGLGWPTKIRPVTAFSEVNASEYWGGKIDPEGYAGILNKVIDSFKAKSQEFFIMNAAFNASARTGSSEIGCIKTDLGVDTCYLSEIEFLKRMEAAVPGILKKLDGWATHTYPHPSYRGRPYDTRVGAESSFEAGRNTIRSYQFEIRLLATFGVSLPIFITETGWPHKEGKTEHPEWYDKNTAAQFYREAFRDIFLPDNRVVAVTPFILKFDNYDNFAFLSSTGEKFPQWEVITSFQKIAGSPPVNR